MSETALVLTQAEWDALEEVVRHYLEATSWAADEATRLIYIKAGQKKHVDQVVERRVVCERIIEVNRP